MKIRTKLYLGIGLLFVLIILLAFFAIKQINTLALASENIIKDNKETIVYAENMLSAISEMDENKAALNTFEKFLAKQKTNITEKGERELTDNLASCFRLLEKNPEDKESLAKARSYLFEILDLNLRAIDHKSTIAANTASKSIFLISFLSLFCIIIALILFIKLPGNISNPINELIKSIKQIADNNYSQKVNFEGHSDFGELAASFNVMSQKLEEYNRSNISKLLAEKKITETLLNKIQYPIIGLDKNLKISLLNEEFKKISGLTGNELIGKNILEVAPENDLIRHLIIIEPNGNKLNDEEKNSKIQIRMHGRDIYYEKEIQDISFVPQNEKDEHLLGYVIILKNVTKFMELDLAKTNFIATVSHELKTPISAIKFSLQLLENEKTGTLNYEQHELIKSCEEDTNTLLKIISELLNLTQVETGKIQLNIMPSSLEDILNYAININKASAVQRNIAFENDYSMDLPDVLIDKEKTAWVLTNLISNAIRYSYDNSKVFISILQTGNKVIISIKDTGQGIESKYKDKIFDRYFRVPGNEKKEGSGLGLAICKEFIEAQGGQITVKSEIGIGSTFSIILNCLV